MVDAVQTIEWSTNFEDEGLWNKKNQMVTIKFGTKLSNHWKINKKYPWKWRRVCKAYKNAILESNVGQMNFENKGETCMTHVVSITRSGMAWSMDWGSSKNAQL